MRKSISRRTGFLGAAAALAVLTALTGCIGVRIIGGVEDSAPHFRKGRARIEAIHRNHPDRQGQARRLRLLIHDGSSRKVIKLSIPVWIVEACLKAGEKEVRR
ncbi:MAG: hypothetical protein FJY81_04185, partial [Candidatus Aminicenantes bacterium]|nr:hypothetical protein [Candidatus Aminicenantes bacterium]